jgi:Kef-type K+ transport system membrane component KefB
MGRIPHFSNTIFPPASIPLLRLTSTLGLVLFMFIIGLEIDLRLLKRNAKASAMISLVGLIIPLGLGAAVAVPLYHEFVKPSINFGYFILFVAVAVGITAFPVLCRILSSLELLDTTVGVVVLGAGAGNDIVTHPLTRNQIDRSSDSLGWLDFASLGCCSGQFVE